MKRQIRAVILAAGKSKRMKSRLSKVLHKILGKEIINFQVDSMVDSGIAENDIIIVCGENLQAVQRVVNRDVRYCIQKEQLGTAHALLSAREYIKDFSGDLLVAVGDNPYITAKELKKLTAYHRQKKSTCTFISALFPHRPPPYGRIIRDSNGDVIDVVEEIDATLEQLKIREVNSSIYMFDNNIVYPLLDEIDNQNEKGEYYLTDIIKILKKHRQHIHAVTTDDHFVCIGINDRWELQQAQRRFNEENIQRLTREAGVTILQPETVTVEFDVEIGRDTVIYPSTYIAAGSRIGENCRIGPFAYLAGVEIKDGETVFFEKRVTSYEVKVNKY
jgi:bifunctional UDP-N-acetylglucosamine pyrophosphorylase/glucosamine-1-phosphate N-acetyltransferase